VFRIPKKFSKNIIKIPDNFAKIIYADDKWSVYEVTYVIDVVKIITIAKGYSVKITADPNYRIPSPTRLSVFADLHNAASLNATTVKNAILASPTAMREAVSSTKTDPNKLTTTYSDASAAISNDIASKIAANPARASTYLPVQMQLVGMTNDARARRLRKSPVLSISTLPPMSDSMKPVGPSRTLAIESILGDGVDPALVGNSPPPVITPHRATQGLSSSPLVSPVMGAMTKAANPIGYGGYSVSQNKKPRFISKTSRPGRAAKELIRRMNRGRMRHARALNQLQSRMQVIAQRVPVRFRTLTKKIAVANNKITGVERLTFKFDLQYRGFSGVTVSFNRAVNHVELLNEYHTPDVPPTITARAGTVGINLLSVKQNDPVGRSIKIQRKVVHTTNSLWDWWKTIKTIPIRFRDGESSLIDKVNNTQTCMYRAIALGAGGQQSHDFDSVTIKPMKIPVPRVPIDRTKMAYVSIFAADSLKDDAVRIRVTNLPPGPCAVYVLASDKTAKCATRPHLGHCRIIGDRGDQTQRAGANAQALTFYDRDVKHDHTYEYTAVMIYPSGKETKSPSPIVHTFRKVQTRNISLQVGQPVLSEDPNTLGQFIGGMVDIAVSIPITANFTDAGLNQVTDSLSSAGISQDFVDEIKDNKQEFQKLLRCEIERQDVLLGETETFGVQAIGTFIDNSVARAVAGVSELQEGRKYIYAVRLLQRSPLGLLEGGSFSTVDLVTKRKYELKVGKFLSPLTLQKGTLPSTIRSLGRSKVSGLVPQDPFLQGATGIEEEVSITIPKAVLPGITDVRVSLTSRLDPVVRWKVKGGRDDFDHFIIYAEYQGDKYIAGKSHNAGEKTRNSYSFVDLQLGDVPGSVTYSVMPVYKDYRYGKETPAPPWEVKYPSHNVDFWANPERSMDWSK
jgi:hypothetical protein